MAKNYLIIDIGTGNFRVGIVNKQGSVIDIKRKDMIYENDKTLGNNIFSPSKIWVEIKKLINEILEDNPTIDIHGVSSTSQRQGIVLFNKNKEAIVGLSNIYHSGYEQPLSEEELAFVYGRTGRQPANTFSAFKLLGIKENKDFKNEIHFFTSISDWVGYEFTENLIYEESQATETLLFDTKENEWSDKLLSIFQINKAWLPSIKESGTILGYLKPEICNRFFENKQIPFIVGGADTQLAVKSTYSKEEEVVVVSGTTSPVIMLKGNYFTDPKKRCWVNKHVDNNQFLIETNGGATGLNYQRVKKLLFPDVSYEEQESNIQKKKQVNCLASFSTLDFDLNKSNEKGGFIFNAPFHYDIKKEDFIHGVILDIACTITYNIKLLEKITESTIPYIIGCGGGFQGNILPQLLADISGKKIIIKDNYKDASLVGAAYLCNEGINEKYNEPQLSKSLEPKSEKTLDQYYKEWLDFKHKINE